MLARNVICVDEVGVREADAERRYARSARGSKAVAPGRSHNTGERGTLHNFICALDIDGMMNCTFNLVGGVNAVIFEHWCAAGPLASSL